MHYGARQLPFLHSYDGVYFIDIARAHVFPCGSPSWNCYETQRISSVVNSLRRHACNPEFTNCIMLLIGEWGFVKVRLRSLVVIEGLDNAEQLSVEG